MTSQTNKNLYSFIDFRDLNKFEINKVLQERNDIEVRRKMFDENVISIQKHLKFLKNLKTDSSKIFILVKRANLYLGVYSIVNIEDRYAQGGFYLFKEARDKNLIVDFLFQTITYIFSKYPIIKIYGYALADNKTAIKINKILGFRDAIPSKSNDQFQYAEIQKYIWENEVSKNDKLIKLIALTQKFYNIEV